MMHRVALKPCPFCKEEACAEIDNVGKEFRIYCSVCPAEMRVTYRDANLDDGSVIAFQEAVDWMNTLVDLWNARA